MTKISMQACATLSVETPTLELDLFAGGVVHLTFHIIAVLVVPSLLRFVLTIL